MAEQRAVGLGGDCAMQLFDVKSEPIVRRDRVTWMRRDHAIAAR